MNSIDDQIFVHALYQTLEKQIVVLTKISINKLGYERAALLSYFIRKHSKILEIDIEKSIRKHGGWLTSEMKKMILDEGFFYIRTEEVTWATEISGRSLEYYIKELEKMNLIEIKIKGIPKTRFVKINYKEISKLHGFKKDPLELSYPDQKDPMVGGFIESEYGKYSVKKDQDLDDDENNDEFASKITNLTNFVNHTPKFVELEGEKSLSNKGKNDTVSHNISIRDIKHKSSSKEEESLRPVRRSANEENDSKAFKRIQVLEEDFKPLAKKQLNSLQDDKPSSARNGRSSSSEPKTYRSCALEIIKYWSDCNLTPPKTTKQENFAISRIELVLRGKLFSDEPGYEKYSNQKFSVEEVKLAIDRFQKSAFDRMVCPATPSMKNKMKKIQIGQWMLNNFVKDEKGKSFSQFIKNFESEPKKVYTTGKISEDKNPEYTKAIKSEYVDNALNGFGPIRKWSVKDENNFIYAAGVLNDFFVKYGNQINTGVIRNGVTPKLAAKWLIKSIVESEGAKYHQISPSWLTSDTTWNTRFPQWLVDQNIMSENGGSSLPIVEKRMSRKEWEEFQERFPEEAAAHLKQREREVYREMGMRERI